MQSYLAPVNKPYDSRSSCVRAAQYGRPRRDRNNRSYNARLIDPMRGFYLSFLYFFRPTTVCRFARNALYCTDGPSRPRVCRRCVRRDETTAGVPRSGFHGDRGGGPAGKTNNPTPVMATAAAATRHPATRRPDTTNKPRATLTAGHAHSVRQTLAKSYARRHFVFVPIRVFYILALNKTGKKRRKIGTGVGEKSGTYDTHDCSIIHRQNKMRF